MNKIRWGNWFIFVIFQIDFDICCTITKIMWAKSRQILSILPITLSFGCLYYLFSRSVDCYFNVKRKKNTSNSVFFLSFSVSCQVLSSFYLVQWWEGLFTLATSFCELFFGLVFFVVVVVDFLCFAIYPVYFSSCCTQQTKSIYCHENVENRML